MRKPFLLLPLVLLAGCGGGGSTTAVAKAVYLYPESQTLTVGQTVPVEVYATGHPHATYALRVVEAGGGTLSPNEIKYPYRDSGGSGLAELYTPSSIPGTYTIEGTVTDPSGTATRVTRIITVAAPGQSIAGTTSGTTGSGL